MLCLCVPYAHISSAGTQEQALSTCSWEVAEKLVMLLIHVFPCGLPKRSTSNCVMNLNTGRKSEVQRQMNKIAMHSLTMYDAFARLFKQTK